jgi:hypothetical protein
VVVPVAKIAKEENERVSRLTRQGCDEYLRVSSRVRAGYELALQEQADFGLA